MKKALLVICLLLATSTCFAWDQSWDQDAPSGSTNANQIDDAIQDFKDGILERLDVDHELPYVSGDTTNTNAMMNDLTAGYHNKVTLLEMSAPTTVSGAAIVYTGTDNELYVASDDYGTVQITDEGKLYADFTTVNATNGYFTGDVTAGDDLTCADDVIVGDDITVTDDLNVTGLATIGETCNVSGDLTTGGHLFCDSLAGTRSDKSANSTYQALSDGILEVYTERNDQNIISFYVSTNQTLVANEDDSVRFIAESSYQGGNSYCDHQKYIRNGEYYRFKYTAGGTLESANFVPIGNNKEVV